MNPDDTRMLVSVLDALPAGLVAVDSQGRVRHVNPRAAEWDQAPPRVRTGQALPAGFPGWLGAAGAAAILHAVASRLPLQLVEFAPRLGVELETRVIPIAEGVLVWVSESPSTGAGTGDSGADGKAGTRSPVHELMQPLGAISNYAELIRHQSRDAVQRHAGEIVRIAAEMAAKLRQRAGRGAGAGAASRSRPPASRDE